ncbi:hypothetical protein Vretifemale_6994, partial [Volvox reticuliferus]
PAQQALHRQHMHKLPPLPWRRGRWQRRMCCPGAAFVHVLMQGGAQHWSLRLLKHSARVATVATVATVADWRAIAPTAAEAAVLAVLEDLVTLARARNLDAFAPPPAWYRRHELRRRHQLLPQQHSHCIYRLPCTQ